MESLERLQNQLMTLGELHAIVKTMKALSAASIRQYEHAVAALASYNQTVERGLYVCIKDLYPLPATDFSSIPRTIIVFGSDHGLCGRFNEAIIEFVLQQLDSNAEETPPRLVTVGTRVRSTFEHLGFAVNEHFLLPSSTAGITSTVQDILFKLDTWRAQTQATQVTLFYNQHAKGRGYEATECQLLPVELQRFSTLPEGRWPSRNVPTFSMPRNDLLSNLVHQYLFVTLFRACAESQASEHASRLSAMQSAQRNLDERLADVTQEFRHARQTEITSELLDIVSGFETIVGRN